MKNIVYLLLFGVLFAGSVNAQERYFDERYVYTQSHVKPILINPAAAGFYGGHEVLFNYNNRWAGFTDSPKTLTVSYNGIAAQRLGVGVLVMKDSYGSLDMTKGQATLSYGFNTGSHKIRVGLSGEYISHKLSNTVWDSEILDPNDFKIRERLVGSQFFDVTIGLMGSYNDKICYGIVFPGLVSSRLNENTTDKSENDFGYIFNLGYKFDIPLYDMKIIPSVYVKNFKGVPGHIDLNLLMKFLDDKLSGGITYSVGGENRLGFLIGTSIRKLDFYYTYNVSGNNFQYYNNGSHELTVGLRFADMVKTAEPVSTME